MVGRCLLLDVVDDDVLFLLLRFLPESTIMRICAGAASVCSRLDGFRGDACVEARQSITQRLARNAVGNVIADAAAAVGSRSADDLDEENANPMVFISGHLKLLCVLASAQHSAKAFRLALELANLPPQTTARAAPFLDALFHSEFQRLLLHRMPGGICGVVSTADAAINALFRNEELAASIIIDCSHAVKQAECDLDRLVDEGHGASFSDVARRRSAVEFLQCRLSSTNLYSSSESSVFTVARARLTEAVRELDSTIEGYVEEGYGLHCSLAFSAPPPRSHWWLFLNGAGPAHGVCG